MKKFLALFLLACAPTQGPQTEPRTAPRRIAMEATAATRTEAFTTVQALADGTAITIQTEHGDFPCIVYSSKCTANITVPADRWDTMFCIRYPNERPCATSEMAKIMWTQLRVGTSRPRIVGH